MTYVSQRGGFHPTLESLVRAELLAEFTEESYGELSVDDFDFAQLCQRKDGSVYGTQGQCRKGTPVSVKPGENALAIRKKALDRGLKHGDVNEVFEALRAKYGRKQVGGEKMVQSLAKRINERLGIDEAGPARRAAQLAARPTVDPALKDSGKGIVVGKGLLKRPDADLQYVLKSRSINDAQRKKIEDELQRRGVEPERGPGAFEKWKQQRDKREKAQDRKLQVGALPGGVPGYNAAQDYKQGGTVLGQGAMGKVILGSGPPPGVVKKGMIGANEVAAIKRLEDTGITPKFHGGAVTGKERMVSGGLGGHVTEQRGVIGMSKVSGVPYSAARAGLDGAGRAAAMDEYIRARKAIHTRGVAHNDMHEGNFFYDTRTNRGGLVDFGLSQLSHKAALLEAMGTFNGRDFQARRMGLTRYDSPAMVRLRQNIEEVELRMEKDFRVTGLPGVRSSTRRIDEALRGMTEKDAETFVTQIYEGV